MTNNQWFFLLASPPSPTHRIKRFDSCCNKVRDKEIKEPFDGLKDIIGLRVVCLFLSDLDKVGEVINQTFEVVEQEDKINDSPHNVFGYLGKHFVVRLKANKDANPMPFEIQVRTIVQDAWASVSYHLDYKTNSIRDDLTRDFNALSGLFYVADTHFPFINQNRIKQN